MHTRTPLHALSLVLLVAMGLPACSDKDDDDDGGTTDSGMTDGGSADGGTSSDGGAADCPGATALLDEDGNPTGFVTCADGAIDRVDGRSWDPTIDGPRCVGDEASRSCDVDADCTDGAYGACLTGEIKGGMAPERYCACTYSCKVDADCDSGELCVGPGVVDGVSSWPQCVPASCESGDDCASGECGIAAWHDGCSWINNIECRSSSDECRIDDDCEGACGVGYDASSFECQEVECALGRPLMTAQGSRVAPVVSGPDWATTLQPRTDLPVGLLARLADHWADVAGMEHASVASFSRFSLQLMSLGAPPALLVETQQALADEIVHARMAYGLASAYGGRPLAPGPLSLDGVVLEQEAEAILVALVEEACVGETLGAAEAQQAARLCTDPVVAGVLDRIAEDESRHAALAWKSLKWLLDTRPELAEVADAAFERAIQSALSRADAGRQEDLSALGLPGAIQRARIRREAVRAVIQPCRAALLGSCAQQPAGPPVPVA